MTISCTLLSDCSELSDFSIFSQMKIKLAICSLSIDKSVAYLSAGVAMLQKGWQGAA